MTTQRNQRAEQLFNEAKTLENKFSLFSKQANLQKASELYNQSGNLYKSSEMYLKAAESFHCAYDILLKIDEKTDAKKAMQNCAFCYSKTEQVDKAVELYEEIIETNIENGNFTNAAKICTEIAKLFEETKNYKKAAEMYVKAAEFYKTDNRPASAIPLRISAAKLVALGGEYLEGFEQFMTIGNEQLSHSTMRFGAKEHFVNAIICQMCLQDDIGAKKSIEKCRKVDASVSSERDYKMMEQMVENLKDNNAEGFEGLVDKYTGFKQVDEFRKIMFERIKEMMHNKEDEEGL